MATKDTGVRLLPTKAYDKRLPATQATSDKVAELMRVWRIETKQEATEFGVDLLYKVFVVMAPKQPDPLDTMLTRLGLLTEQENESKTQSINQS